MPKIGPGTKTSARPSAGVLQDLHAGDVRRHQVGRELDAPELEVEDLRDRFHEQRLRQAGRAGDEAVPAGEKRDEDLLDDVLLADDHLPQLSADPPSRRLQHFKRFVLGRKRRRRGHARKGSGKTKAVSSC